MMTNEIKNIINNSLLYLATASKTGIPNVVPIGGAKALDENRILIIDVLLNKTKINILENPRVAIIAENLKHNTPLSYQIKGTAVIHTEGEFFHMAEELSIHLNMSRKRKNKREHKVRSGVVVTVTDIYSNMHAGKNINEITL